MQARKGKGLKLVGMFVPVKWHCIEEKISPELGHSHQYFETVSGSVLNHINEN
jgi:hypothetical protein